MTNPFPNVGNNEISSHILLMKHTANKPNHMNWITVTEHDHVNTDRPHNKCCLAFGILIYHMYEFSLHLQNNIFMLSATPQDYFYRRLDCVLIYITE